MGGGAGDGVNILPLYQLKKIPSLTICHLLHLHLHLPAHFEGAGAGAREEAGAGAGDVPRRESLMVEMSPIEPSLSM